MPFNEGLLRNASSRRRKKAFIKKEIKIFFFKSHLEIEKGRTEGWIKGFQENMRNANGSPRRVKLQVDLKSIPEKIQII